jgi:ribosomal protein S6
MELYTMEQWKADRTFKAEPGQEIAADVYEQMLNCMPPKTLPQEKARQALQDYKIPVHAGFLMGEPHSSDKRGQHYLAFGMNDYGKGKHYYYLGLSLPVKKIQDGSYYFMDCLNAFVNGGLFPASEFKDDADAIQTAANYEATLYKYEYKHGERISSVALYEPQFM